MMRPSVIVISMSMLVACGGLAYLHSTREQAAEEASVSEPRLNTAPTEQLAPTPAASNNVVASAATETRTSPGSDQTTPAGNAPPPETIAQWIKDTQSTDAKTRAAAIAALADAPKALAMPALKRVLDTGDPNVDRHIALRSMHSIALRDGDSTGQVRDVMRRAIYHGDDDGVTQTAQSLLDDIEADFAQREQNRQ
jgi:hypothetical protein